MNNRSVPPGLVAPLLFLITGMPTPAHGEGGTPIPLKTGNRVTFAQVLAHAQNHAPAIEVARSRLRLGEAELTAASPLLLDNPELEISAGPRISPQGEEVDLEVSLQQRFEIAGERGLRIRAAEGRADNLQAGLERTRWDVHQLVHGAFHSALVTRERIKAAKHLVQFSQRLLVISRKREAAGAISMLHVKVAEGELFQAKQEEIRAVSAYQAIRLTLAEVAGWPPGPLPDPVGRLEAPRRAPELGKLTERALASHPRLRSRVAAIKEAEAQVELADREAFPRPALGVAYSREAEVAGDVNHIVMGSLSLSIPLWQRNQGARAAARASAAVARAGHGSLKRLLRTRVARAATALDAAAQRVEAYGRDVVPAFQKNLEMIRLAFQEGKVDVLQVMVARGRFLEIQRETLAAHEDYYAAHAELEAMVGAEIWPPGPGQEGR